MLSIASLATSYPSRFSMVSFCSAIRSVEVFELFSFLKKIFFIFFSFSKDLIHRIIQSWNFLCFFSFTLKLTSNHNGNQTIWIHTSRLKRWRRRRISRQNLKKGIRRITEDLQSAPKFLIYWRTISSYWNASTVLPFSFSSSLFGP